MLIAKITVKVVNAKQRTAKSVQPIPEYEFRKGVRRRSTMTLLPKGKKEEAL